MGGRARRERASVDGRKQRKRARRQTGSPVHGAFPSGGERDAAWTRADQVVADMAYKNMDEYIASFPEDVQERLQRMRETIQQAAPGATEAMSYGVPAFKLNGNLVLFAAFKKHVGLYPEPSAIGAFKEELSEYETARGTIKFPLERPIPYDLVARIVEFRVKENLEKQAD